MKTSVRWGVLGAASIAMERTIPAMAEASGATCVALASRDGERASSLAAATGIARAYGGYQELLDDPEVDAVYVPLPNQLHLRWSLAALRSGKAVLCEKPLCLTSAEVRELIAARDETGGLIEEALVFRNHPQWAAIERIFAEGRIGRPLAVQGTIAKQFLDPHDIRNQPGLGGGATYDLGTYVIAACNLVFGRAPLRVSATMEMDPAFGVDQLVSAILDYGDAQASFIASSQGGTAAWATHQRFSVLGSDGWLSANFPYAQARPTACDIAIGDRSSVGDFPVERIHFPPANQYALQIERFSNLVGGEQARSWPIEDSLVTLQVIEAMFRSARSAQWESLPPS